MAGIALKIDKRVLDERLRRLGANLEPKTYLRAVGLAWVREINETFKREGRKGEQWKPLAPSTIAGRKKGPNKGVSDKILQDRGDLKRSFNPERGGMTVTNKFVRVGTNIRYAEHHEFGTRAFTIRPRAKKALKFTGADGSDVFAKSVNHPGIPKRPMLPTKKTALEIADKAGRNMVKRLARDFNKP